MAENSFVAEVTFNELIRSKTETSRLDFFVNTVLKVLNKNAPVKKRCIRSNEASFMNKFQKRQL